VRITLLLLALLAGGPAVADPRQDTDAAIATMRAAEQAMGAASVSHAALNARYQEELRAIDRIKKQRGSWRRDRQLRDSLAVSLDTAKRLEAAAAELQKAKQRQEQARRQAATVIVAELASPIAVSRRAQLTRERDRLVPAAAASKKLVLPDLEIDPLADPEELEQQAASIRQSESILAAQVAALDQRSEQLGKVVELRRQHQRAAELSDREDGPTRRGAPRSARENTSGDSAGPAGAPSGEGNGSGSGSGGVPPVDSPARTTISSGDEIAAFAESSLVLGDIIDAAALESLRKAQTSSDPAVRAAAAKQAYAAAAARLVTVRKQRAKIEERARALRSPPR
jgi:hypothetical protein